MKIATFNINSINARIANLLAWLKEQAPDVVLLQEIKCEYNAFPFLELASVGYEAKVLGQKSYNGVAILSRYKISEVVENLPQFPDEQARYLEADVDINGEKIRVASVYLPNGNPPVNAPRDDAKFLYKLDWMDALYLRAKTLLQNYDKVLLGGDFNTILRDDDVYNPEAFRQNALFRKEVRDRFHALEYLGYGDAFRLLHPTQNGYSFWDYGAKSFELDWGMRIDYLLVSPLLADCLEGCFVDKAPRALEKPSDHTPLIATFNS